MKTQLIYAALLIIGIGAMGCGSAIPEPPLACSDDPIQLGEYGEFSFQYCQVLGMECNEAVTLADECPGFMDELEVYIRDVLIPSMGEDAIPPYINMEEFVAMLFDEYVGICGDVEFLGELGTCQPRSGEGGECAEDDDCVRTLACVGGLCAVPPPPPECVEDADCDGDLICVEGTCVEPPPPECVEDLDCETEFVCVEGMCVEPPPPAE